MTAQPSGTATPTRQPKPAGRGPSTPSQPDKVSSRLYTMVLFRTLTDSRLVPQTHKLSAAELDELMARRRQANEEAKLKAEVSLRHDRYLRLPQHRWLTLESLL